LFLAVLSECLMKNLCFLFRKSKAQEVCEGLFLNK
jgi:hypothetical protein